MGKTTPLANGQEKSHYATSSSHALEFRWVRLLHC